MSNVGITLSADDKELLRVLKSVEGRLDGLEAAARGSMAGTASAANQAAQAMKALEAQTGVSARQMQAALRGVPAQFTDIATSLAAGQNPLTVFLQQGGQLKDMFGGAGAAARALGGYVLGLINPITLAAATVATLGIAAYQGRQEMIEFQKTLILTGNAGGYTAGGLMDAAAAVRNLGAGTQGRAAEIINQLAAGGQVGAASMARFTAAALQLERVGGPAAEDTAKAFASLGKDPLAASIKLNESTNYLTADLYRQIRALDDQGRGVDAARVAQDAYAASLEQRTPQVLANLGLIERAWMSITNRAKGAWDFLKDIGRPDTNLQELQYLQAQLAANKAKGVGNTAIYGGQTENDQLREQLALVSRRLMVEQEVAMAEGQRAQSTKQLMDWDKDGVSFQTQRAQVAKAIKQTEAEGAALIAAGLITQADLQARVNALRGEFDSPYAIDKIRSAESARAEEIKRQVMAVSLLKATGYMNERAAIEATSQLDLAAIDNRMRSIRAEMDVARQRKDPERELAALQTELASLEQQRTTARLKGIYDVTAAIEKQRQAIESVIEAQRRETNDEQDKFFVEQSKARERVGLSISKYEQSVRDSGEALQLEGSLLGATNEQRAVRLAQFRVELELRKKIDEINATSYDSQEQREREIARVRTAAAIESAQVSAKAALEVWQRTADQIGDAITEALINSGEDFSKSFKRIMANAFKTMVLQPAVRSAVQSLQGSLMGVGGQSGGGLGGLFSGGMQSAWSGLSGLFGGSRSAGSTGPVNDYLTTGGVEGSIVGGGTGGGAGAVGGSAAGAAVNMVALYATAAAVTAKLAMKDQAMGFTARSAREAGDGFGGKYGVGTVFAEASSLFQKLGMNSKWADILSMSTGFAKVFGRGQAQGVDQGISGTIGGGMVNAQAFQDWRAKGGLFRSDKTGTNFSGLDPSQGAALSGYAKKAMDTVGDWAKVLGLSVDSLSNVSQDFRISLGKDDAANQKAVEEMVAKYRDALAGQYEEALKPLRKVGETVTDTLQRLAGLQQFSETLNGLGGVFSHVATLGVDARESFIAMAGGMESLSQQAQGFVQNYYNRDEIAGVKAREVLGILSSAGFSGSQLSGLDTRDEFRALVEGLDLSTQAGQQQLAALLQVQGDFAQLSDYFGTTGGTLTTSALLAPTSALLDSPIVEPQVTAINGVRDSVDSLAPWLERIVNAVTEGRGENESVTYTGGGSDGQGGSASEVWNP